MAFALQKAIDGLEKPFGSLLRQLSPDYVVHDFAQYWAQNVAAAMRVPSVSKPGPDDREGSDLLDWLDRQRPSSVVFVSFGSETFLSREQAHELVLGLGLEASGLPFLCSLRVPHFLDNPREYALELLPEGFETRTQDQGLVVWGWVPQVRIVSHPSVGAYLSHSGWSSAMEALTFGVPLVLLPVKLDQSLNARQIASELKLGIEVERGDDGSFLSENIAAALRMVMAGKEGKNLRSKVKEARDIIVASSGRQQDYIHEFIKQLEQIAVAYTQI